MRVVETNFDDGIAEDEAVRLAKFSNQDVGVDGGADEVAPGTEQPTHVAERATRALLGAPAARFEAWGYRDGVCVG